MNRFPNPILYLYQHQRLAEEILRWKNDEDLIPWVPDCDTKSIIDSDINSNTDSEITAEAEPEQSKDIMLPKLPSLLQVGIGNYKTIQNGEIYLCVLIDPHTRRVESYSIAVHRSPELVDKALENLFFTHQKMAVSKTDHITIKSSQNAIYKTKAYTEILAKYPVTAEMTEKGTRGGVMPVSTFYSQLMRKRGSVPFASWQDAVDWLCSYIYHYNRRHQEAGLVK